MLSSPRLNPVPLPRYSLRVPAMMRRLLYAMSLPLLAACAVYGVPALLVLLASVLGMITVEAFMKAITGNRQRVGDGSAILSGVLLAMLLPPAMDPLIVFLTAFAGGFLSKQLFGGLGRNPLNPAVFSRLLIGLFGHEFFQSAYLKPLWWLESFSLTAPQSAYVSTLPLQQATQASQVLCCALKDDVKLLPEGWDPTLAPLQLSQLAQDILTSFTWKPLLFPCVAGEIGSVSLLLFLPGLLFLLVTRLVDWRLPLSAMLTFLAILAFPIGGASLGFAVSFSLVGTLWILYSSVLACDPVTTPVTQTAKWLFGLLFGSMSGLLFLWTECASSMILALLFLNLLVPWLDLLTEPKGIRVK
jgi:Na+-translocating ferredoxin:NAD+ oxidoreductase subunit D